MLPSLDRDAGARLRGRPRLLLFDIDGTLAPITRHPHEAQIPETTRAVLALLADQPATHIALVSGRSASDAKRFLPGVRTWVIGNHGIELLDPSGTLSVHPAVEPYREAVASAARALAAVSLRFPGTVLEDKTWTLSMHYRLAEEPVAAPLRLEIARIAQPLGLRITEGKKIYEVRPTFPVDKGTAVVELARSLGGLAPGASVLFAGDDLTDEDAFIALAQVAPHALTVRVSDTQPVALKTAATMVARDPAALGDFLDWLVRAPTAGDAR